MKGYMGLIPQLDTARYRTSAGDRSSGRGRSSARSGSDAGVADFQSRLVVWSPVVRWRRTSARLARVQGHRSSGLDQSSGGSSGAGRPDPTGLPVAGASSTALLLASSFPSFRRGWCSCTLALALLLFVHSVLTIPMHAHEWSVK